MMLLWIIFTGGRSIISIFGTLVVLSWVLLYLLFPWTEEIPSLMVKIFKESSNEEKRNTSQICIQGDFSSVDSNMPSSFFVNDFDDL